MQYKQLRAVLAPVPAEIPYLPVSSRDEAEVVAKVRAFFRRAGAESMALSAEELNHLIRTSRPLADLGIRYHLELDDTLFRVRSSVPAEDMRGVVNLLLKVSRMKGYFNSVMRGYPLFRSGKLELVPVSASMNEVAAPVSALSRRGNVDPRDLVEDKAFYDMALRQLVGIRIRAGALLLIREAPP